MVYPKPCQGLAEQFRGMASPESARLVGRHADASDVRAAHGTHPGALRLQVPWRSGGNLVMSTVCY